MHSPRRAQNRPFSGQSLVEFVLVAPLLVLILLAGAMIGLAMYQGNLSSEAIKEPTLHKKEMAAMPGAVSTATLLGYTQGGARGNVPSAGAALDSIRRVDINDRVAVLIGSKNYRPPMGSFLPDLSYTFSVSNAIQRNLLVPADMGGATQRQNNDIAKRSPPWEIAGVIPEYGGCAKAPGLEVLPAGARAVTMASSTYLSSADWMKLSQLDVTAIYELAKQYAPECANAGAGVCQAEYEALQPRKEEGRFRSCFDGGCESVFNNPPGAPGLQVTVKVSGKTPTVTSQLVNGYGADSGMYYDPTGAYTAPPADFIDSCMKVKQGECALSKAADRANELAQILGEECYVQ